MIAPEHTTYNAVEMNEEGTVQAVLALLNQRQAARVPRWVCDVCGMIHTGVTPLACDSCGSECLTQQADLHREMNHRW